MIISTFQPSSPSRFCFTLVFPFKSLRLHPNPLPSTPTLIHLPAPVLVLLSPSWFIFFLSMLPLHSLLLTPHFLYVPSLSQGLTSSQVESNPGEAAPQGATPCYLPLLLRSALIYQVKICLLSFHWARQTPTIQESKARREEGQRWNLWGWRRDGLLLKGCRLMAL